MFKIVEIIKKYREVIMYLIFGVLTTIVNIAIYLIFTNFFNLDYLISNVIAWIVSVLFAYITNKIYVFESKAVGKKLIFFEIISFFSFRLISGLMDMGLMFVFVSFLGLNDTFMKIITNIIVVFLNYIFSKLFIFKNKSEKYSKIK